MNENTMLSLDIILQQQLLLENLEAFQGTPLYKQKKVNLVKSLIRELEKDTVSDFNKAFDLDAETLREIQHNYVYAIKSLAVRNVPNKVILSQMMMAYECDPSGMEATTSRILKKELKK